MKKQWKRATALVLAALMVLSLTACGGDKGSNGGTKKEASADEIIKTSLEKSKGIKSLDTEMKMVMKITAKAPNTADQSAAINMDVKMTMFNDPMKGKLDIAMDMGAQGKQNMTAYIQKDDGKNVMYVTDGNAWVKQTISEADLAQYDAADQVTSYMTSAQKFEKQGTEEINGKPTFKIQGILGGEMLKEAINSTGAVDQLAAMGVDKEEIYKDIKDLPVTIWIDQETNYPVKYAMDMTEMMQGIYQKMMESLGDKTEGRSITCDELSTVITCSNFNGATDFQIPQEALDAPSV